MFRKQLAKFRQNSPERLIFIYYFAAIVVATLLLSLPVFYRMDYSEMAFIDILFVASSALSVTGLSSVDIASTFNLWGYVVIMFIMNLGGVGIMAMGTMIWLLLGQKIGLRERMQIRVDTNQYKISGGVRMVIDIIGLMLLIELVGAVYYFFVFLAETGDWNYALLHSTFLSISATTNGGLDLFSGSLTGYDTAYHLQVPVMMQIVLGSIGYPVLIEVRNFLSRRRHHFRFSLFTKVTTATYGGLFVVGTLIIFIMEWKDYFNEYGVIGTLFNSMFLSVTSRSGGLTTVPIDMLDESTQLFMSALMFIGASPSSAGGGIRTTTFAILLLFLIAFSRGRAHIHAFNRNIARADIDRAFAVIALAVFLVFAGVTSIVFLENGKFEVADILFEVTSAFGTAGISTGITSELSEASKLIIIAFMFIGRIGFISFILFIGGRQHTHSYEFPEERIMVG
ncbi:TrkH family potassium uptake protein [Salinicoccus halitifaciens]|uniref:Trk-type K+ transport system membrane component n=1 Tax=Salinicoccus halitifaciens TaxID=1073415 RepID=A0ABV2ECG9_9STAP|nr:TrkH family potassium uptake protein [Salinicoccus halitifaciens]MCD2138724.1 TrkH family potassium uptake protein [Salinicoccus halitifaciens]